MWVLFFASAQVKFSHPLRLDSHGFGVKKKKRRSHPSRSIRLVLDLFVVSICSLLSVDFIAWLGRTRLGTRPNPHTLLQRRHPRAHCQAKSGKHSNSYYQDQPLACPCSHSEDLPFPIQQFRSCRARPKAICTGSPPLHKGGFIKARYGDHRWKQWQRKHISVFP